MTATTNQGVTDAVATMDTYCRRIGGSALVGDYVINTKYCDS